MKGHRILASLVAVALMAQQQGVARLHLSREELLSKAEATISQAREMVQFLMDKEIIPPVPEKWR